MNDVEKYEYSHLLMERDQAIQNGEIEEQMVIEVRIINLKDKINQSEQILQLIGQAS